MEKQINKAVEVLQNGGVILYPTDTIWGIGCNAKDEQAVEKVYKIKKRNESKALISLVSTKEDLNDLKKFIRQEQAILRREQAEKRRRFLEEIKLEKKIKSFRKRELQEI